MRKGIRRFNLVLAAMGSAILVLAAAPAARGLGEDAPAIALWSLPEHAELPAGAPSVGLVAYHLNGIERVEFRRGDAVVATATAESRNPVTGEFEFVGRLDLPDLAPGAAFPLASRVFPREGRGVATDVPVRTFRIADPAAAKAWTVDAGKGSDETGDGTAANPVRTVARALQLAKGGDQVLLGAGAHELVLDEDRKFDRFVTIRPAPDAEARIVKVGNPRCGMLKFEDLWFDWRGNDSATVFGAYSAPHYWFRNCRFAGTPGRFDNYTRALKFWGKSTNVTVEGCTFEHLDVAIAAPPESILRGNTIRHMTSDAFNYSGRTLVSGNTITGLRAPRTFAESGAAEPFDLRGAARLTVTHRETSTDRAYEVSLEGLPDAGAARAADVAEAMNRVFAAGAVRGEFGLVAEAVDGRVRVTSRRTNYRQTIFFEGPANRALRFAAEGREKAVSGSGQHADVFQSWGGPKSDIIIRNNRAYDNVAQQWLAQDEALSNVAFYNNLLDAHSETAWAVMLGGRFDNFVIEFNTIWNAVQATAFRREMFEHGRNRNFVVRNNILGTGTGVGGLPDERQHYADYNLHDYDRGAPAGLGPNSKWTNPERKHPTESRLFAKVQVRTGADGGVDYHEAGGDFSPGPDSPAVDAGSSASGIRYDLNWNPRDDRPDIGAFEYQKPPPAP